MRMSDSSMYELESIAWDDFSENDDHSVPYPGGKPVADFNALGDCCDKLRHEMVAASRKRLDKTLPARGPESNFLNLKGRTAPMQEKVLWSHTSKTVCPDVNDADCLKEVANLASDDVIVSTNCFKDSKADLLDNEFFTDDVALDKKNSTMDGNSCPFPLDDIFSTDSDLDFFGNDHRNKKSTYLPCYEWPDVDKFEDFGRMCRGCDSTFVPGHVTNEDDMSFFSSSLSDLGGPEDVLKSGFKSSSPEASTLRNHQGDAKFPENDASLIIDSSGEKNITNAYKLTSWALDSGASAILSCSSFANWSGSNSEERIKSVSKEQHHMRPLLSVALQYESLVDHAAFTGVRQINDEIGGHCEVEGLRMDLSAGELDSSHLQESSCLSSTLSEENSLKTSSFQQLQLVMGQLDVRMKLCIRDSLYRLANSAKRRHHLGTSDSSIKDGGDKSEVTTIEEQDRCTRFVDNKTHTNSIDRSMAQLLFHRPSDPANDTVSLQSHAKIAMCQSLLPEKACEEEIASYVDTKLQVIDRNSGK